MIVKVEKMKKMMGDKKYNAKEALTSIYLVKNKEEKEGYLCLGGNYYTFTNSYKSVTHPRRVFHT